MRPTVGFFFYCVLVPLIVLFPARARAEGPFVAKDAASFTGKTVGSGECVDFVKKAADAPETSKWVRGAKVRDNKDIAKGTAIATLTEDGYPNNATGNHAAIFDEFDADKKGFYVWDQWTGQPVHRRLIRYKGGQGSKSNDGDAFYVISG
jgi:hypothetical protein